MTIFGSLDMSENQIANHLRAIESQPWDIHIIHLDWVKREPGSMLGHNSPDRTLKLSQVTMIELLRRHVLRMQS